MQWQQAFSEILAPYHSGEEIPPGARFRRLSLEYGVWLVFDTRIGELQVECLFPEEAENAVAASERFRFRYRATGDRREMDRRFGERLCQQVATLARANEEAVLARIAALVEEQEDPEHAAKVREVEVDRLLEPSGCDTNRFLALHPYAGCLIGCRFCYAQSQLVHLRRLLGLPKAPWGSYVDVRVNAPEVLGRELRAYPPVPVRFTPITSDPYHAIERRYRLTRRCLETLLEVCPERPVQVMTRSSLILEDMDLLGRFPNILVGVSIPTIDEAVRKHFEPRAASVAERIEILRQAKERGIGTFAVAQPLLPGSPLELAEALEGLADSVSIGVLSGEYGAKDDFDTHAEARSEAWQQAQAAELARLFTERKIPLWRDEGPPEMQGNSSS